ncbi:Uncharacterised protein [Salmonella enterica subsp. enterica serovar Bovismorbificans]|uniref:Uncharacterized protein n=1 Tax=Salmonella enterica subsp. enterica serovar Bovismorbificans TaxID=58097 RepID=A0A655BMS3_SALET|nr:Uncharacterised protein [Salmonella enterica subsp. enterica serovar Bovismorbificans]CPR48206.1 Uncharacterised protein [Salmonella enterica subsp. enterica serovar Bovismorbificans]CPR49507.1 Uncharacterised protein [Salmonella enterica subsp. enterica serovar Bovismorbificans]CQB66045.1 Uncharacterised protein [Salmonella enterica subsp. enterica serovar Bovismorbificans]
MACYHVNNRRRDKERANLTRSAFYQRTVVFFDQTETTDTGADSGANTACVLFRHFKARILHGLYASDNSILNEGIHLALFFARDNVITVKILY